MFPKSKIAKDKRLRECNYGKFNGKPMSVVYSMKEKCVDKKFPGGESYKDVEKRIKGFLKAVSNKYKDKHIAIVSHQGPQLALDVIVKKKTWG